MGYGWEGELVRLVPIDIDKHLPNAQRWMNDPDATRNLVAGDLPMTFAAQREWLEQKSKQDEREVVFAIELLSGEHIGFSSVHDINWKGGTALTGSLIGDEGNRGKGYGTDAALIRNRYAFEVLGLRYLMTSVFEGNERSLKMLRKCGFVECGRYPKKFWKRGRYVDDILLYITRDIWAELEAGRR